jgi:hypothetical protein
MRPLVAHLLGNLPAVPADCDQCGGPRLFIAFPQSVDRILLVPEQWSFRTSMVLAEPVRRLCVFSRSECRIFFGSAVPCLPRVADAGGAVDVPALLVDWPFGILRADAARVPVVSHGSYRGSWAIPFQWLFCLSHAGWASDFPCVRVVPVDGLRAFAGQR